MTDAELFSHIKAAEIAELCRDMIRINTTNPPGDELKAAQFVFNWLKQYGFEGEFVHSTDTRASLVARLKGKGEIPAVMLNGHLDVVPVGAQPWLHEPFAGDIADGKVWGRGSCDMKGGLAAQMIAARAIALSKKPLRGDLIVSATAGEELLMIGANALADLPGLGAVQVIIIAEPTLNSYCLAERGVLWPEITTYGKTAHGSTPEQGINAIKMMLPVIDALEKLDIPYTPHPTLGHFTRSLNTIQGGMKTNVVPDSCVITYDFRTTPGQDHKKILAQLEDLLKGFEKTIPDFKFSLSATNDLLPAETSADLPIVKKFQAAASKAAKRTIELKFMTFATEACIFVPKLNIPTIVLGPGDPKLAHQPNEYVDIGLMEEAAQIYAVAALDLLS